MFKAIWAAVIIINGVPTAKVVAEEPQPYASRAACEQAVAQHKTRAADWLRGVARTDWRSDIEVEADCQPVGDPS